MPPRSADVARELLRRIDSLEEENAVLRARVETDERRAHARSHKFGRAPAERLWAIAARFAPARARPV